MPEVTVAQTGPHRVSRTVLVNAPAATLFDLVADPHRHHELDGSGTVQEKVEGPERLSEGATFSNGMKQGPARYTIKSRVTEFVTDRVIAWRHPMGHHWRWEFTPEGAGSTRVTETFDYSGLGKVQTALFEKVFRIPKINAKGIEATLERLAARY